jgi:hypothetical protein
MQLLRVERGGAYVGLVSGGKAGVSRSYDQDGDEDEDEAELFDEDEQANLDARSACDEHGAANVPAATFRALLPQAAAASTAAGAAVLWVRALQGSTPDKEAGGWRHPVAEAP